MIKRILYSINLYRRQIRRLRNDIREQDIEIRNLKIERDLLRSMMRKAKKERDGWEKMTLRYRALNKALCEEMEIEPTIDSEIVKDFQTIFDDPLGYDQTGKPVKPDTRGEIVDLNKYRGKN